MLVPALDGASSVTEFAAGVGGASIFDAGELAAVSVGLGRDSQCQARPPTTKAASAAVSRRRALYGGFKMMHDWWIGGGWGMGFGWLFMLLPLAVLVLLVVGFVRNLRQQSQS